MAEQAGNLREQVGFYTRPEVATEYGIATSDWQLQFTRSARVQAIRTGETVMGQRLKGQKVVIITIRYNAEAKTITESWQARDERTGEQYQIRKAVPDEKRQWIDVLAESGVAQ